MMSRKWFTPSNTPVDEASLETLNRAIRIYLFGTSKTRPTRDDLLRARLALRTGAGAQQIAEKLHNFDVGITE
jgi:hypothetical protein